MMLCCQTIDESGDIWAEPAQNDKGGTARIHFIPKASGPSIAVGDFMLCRLEASAQEGVDFEARLIRKITPSSATPRQDIIGVYQDNSDNGVAGAGGRISPVDKKGRGEWAVATADKNGAQSGELVRAVQISSNRAAARGFNRGQRARAGADRRDMGLPKARIVERLGVGQNVSPSMIALHTNDIPIDFPPDVLAEAKQIQPDKMGKREDLRDLPFITIDPFDARDHDDAIFAQPDPDPKNKGGFILWVAIADVAAYLRKDSVLDAEALMRGNSCYFPDRVVPMLPERLSNDLCSLRAGQDRPVLAVAMTIDSRGEKIAHKFHRAMIRSAVALSYQQVQKAADGVVCAEAKPFLPIITALYEAYAALSVARDKRAPLDLDLPERKIILSADGAVESVRFAERLEAHKLVEVCMILANTCAAETLEQAGAPFLYRVHETPPKERLDALGDVLRALGLKLAKGQRLLPAQLNGFLRQSAGKPYGELVNTSVLRAMTQAYYSPESLGHFGLNLARYCHFTSPIRRYADVIVHRALIDVCGFTGGRADKKSAQDSVQDLEDLVAIAEQISALERRAMVAEREATDRFLAAFLARDIGADFAARINGFSRFGIFVRLVESVADGVIPMRSLRGEYWQMDRDKNILKGGGSGCIIGLGMDARVCLQSCNAQTGEIIFELVELEGKPLPKPRSAGSRKGGRGRGRGVKGAKGGGGFARKKHKTGKR